MGVLDVAKMAMKARKMQSEMGKTKSAGKSGSVGVIINGLYSIVGFELYMEVLTAKFPKIDPVVLEQIASSIMEDVKKANEDAKNSLQKDMAKNANLDDLKNMFQ